MISRWEMHNERPAGKGGVLSLFHMLRARPALPEDDRSAA